MASSFFDVQVQCGDMEVEKKIDEKIDQFIDRVEKHPNKKNQVHNHHWNYVFVWYIINVLQWLCEPLNGFLVYQTMYIRELILDSLEVFDGSLLVLILML